MTLNYIPGYERWFKSSDNYATHDSLAKTNGHYLTAKEIRQTARYRHNCIVIPQAVKRFAPLYVHLMENGVYSKFIDYAVLNATAMEIVSPIYEKWWPARNLDNPNASLNQWAAQILTMYRYCSRTDTPLRHIYYLTLCEALAICSIKCNHLKGIEVSNGEKMFPCTMADIASAHSTLVKNIIFFGVTRHSAGNDCNPDLYPSWYDWANTWDVVYCGWLDKSNNNYKNSNIAHSAIHA
jgi:hypothetical protein